MPEITARLSTALADRYKIERHLGERLPAARHPHGVWDSILRRYRCAPVDFLAAVLAAALTGCSPPTDAAGLAGSYVMTIGADTLRLDATGHYVRVIGTAVDSGRWTVSERGPFVVLHDLPQRWPEHGRYDPSQGWHAPDTTVRQDITLTIASTWTGRTTLQFRPEIGWNYMRVRHE